jgi:hypothetical protein
MVDKAVLNDAWAKGCWDGPEDEVQESKEVDKVIPYGK